MELIEVIVKPKSAETRILKNEGNKFIIAVKAPAEDDKANIALLKFLKKHFRRHAMLIRGRTERRKIIRLD